MNDDRLATAGSSRIFAASACCRSDIAENEIDWGASVTAWFAALSFTGKKPFGTMRYNPAAGMYFLLTKRFFPGAGKPGGPTVTPAAPTHFFFPLSGAERAPPR